MIDEIELMRANAKRITDKFAGAHTVYFTYLKHTEYLLSLVKRLEENNQSLLNDNNQLSIKLNNLKDDK